MSSSKPTETKVAEPIKNEVNAQLGVLEEDDEFEEFPVSGAHTAI